MPPEPGPLSGAALFVFTAPGRCQILALFARLAGKGQQWRGRRRTLSVSQDRAVEYIGFLAVRRDQEDLKCQEKL
jgi:hypothetical protein